MAEGRVTQIMRERRKLDDIQIDRMFLEVGMVMIDASRYCLRNLLHFNGMSEAIAKEISLSYAKYLSLALKAPKAR